MFLPQNVSFLFILESDMYIYHENTFQRQLLVLDHIICKTKPQQRQISWPISAKWQCDDNDLQSNTDVLSNHKIKYLETGIKLTSIKRFIRLLQITRVQEYNSVALPKNTFFQVFYQYFQITRSGHTCPGEMSNNMRCRLQLLFDIQ